MKKIISITLICSLLMVFFCANVSAASPTVGGRKTTSSTVSGVTMTANVDQMGMQVVSTYHLSGNAYSEYFLTVQIYNNNTLPALVDSAGVTLNLAASAQILDVANYSPDLTLSYFNGTSFTITPSNDYSYTNGIVVPPKESLYMVATVRIDAPWNSTSGSYAPVTLSSVSIPTFTVGTSASYPYGTPTDFSPIISYLSDYSSGISDINTNIIALSTALNNFYARNHTDFVNTYNRLGNMLTKLTVLDNLETLLTTIEGNTDDLETLLTSIDGNVADIDTDIDSLITKLTNIYNTLDYFSTRNHNDIADVEGQLGSMYTRLGQIITLLTYTGTVPGSGYINANSQRSAEISDTYYVANTQITAFGSYYMSGDYEAVFPSSYYYNYTYCIPVQVYFRLIVRDDLKFNYASIDLLDVSNAYTGTIELDEVTSGTFTDVRLYVTNNVMKLGIFCPGTLAPGTYYFDAWLNLYVMNGTTVPAFPNPITLNIDGITTVNNTISDKANDITTQSNAIHNQESAYYQQNQSAIESTGLQNFNFSTSQTQGGTKVRYWFGELWNALGDWNSVYVFSLTVGLAVLVIRHYPHRVRRKEDD